MGERRCYVCNALPQDGCQAIDGEMAECPRPSPAVFVRTVPNVMRQFGCSQETAQRYCDLRDEGHGMEQAKLMAGLSDPPEDDEPEDDSPYCGGCNPEPTLDETDSGTCASCGKELA